VLVLPQGFGQASPQIGGCVAACHPVDGGQGRWSGPSGAAASSCPPAAARTR
jgi:hypothetical protein